MNKVILIATGVHPNQEEANAQKLSQMKQKLRNQKGFVNIEIVMEDSVAPSSTLKRATYQVEFDSPVNAFQFAKSVYGFPFDPKMFIVP